jgi:hypothetical protein
VSRFTGVNINVISLDVMDEERDHHRDDHRHDQGGDTAAHTDDESHHPACLASSKDPRADTGRQCDDEQQPGDPVRQRGGIERVRNREIQRPTYLPSNRATGALTAAGPRTTNGKRIDSSYMNLAMIKGVGSGAIDPRRAIGGQTGQEIHPGDGAPKAPGDS